MQPDDQDPWLFSRNHLPPQTASWGEIKQMVRARRLRADDMLAPVEQRKPGKAREEDDGSPPRPGVWQTAEEVFQNLPYEEGPTPAPARRRDPRVLWAALAFALVTGMGFWYESIKRPRAAPAAVVMEHVPLPPAATFPPLPAPPAEASAPFLPPVEAEAPLPSPSSAPTTSSPPPGKHLVIPPELLQFQRYDPPRAAVKAETPAAMPAPAAQQPLAQP